MPLQSTSFHSNNQNLINISPQKGEDKQGAKSATNKSYLLGKNSQMAEENKRSITQQYLKAFQKVSNTLKQQSENK